MRLIHQPKSINFSTNNFSIKKYSSKIFTKADVSDPSLNVAPLHLFPKLPKNIILIGGYVVTFEPIISNGAANDLICEVGPDSFFNAYISTTSIYGDAGMKVNYPFNAASYIGTLRIEDDVNARITALGFGAQIADIVSFSFQVIIFYIQI
jgi:hypothetical protein